MAKHAVPKKRVSKKRSATRYGSFKTKVLRKISNSINLVDCPDCGKKTRTHFACPSCGKYRGRQVVDMQKEVDKITKIKA